MGSEPPFSPFPLLLRGRRCLRGGIWLLTVRDGVGQVGGVALVGRELAQGAGVLLKAVLQEHIDLRNILPSRHVMVCVCRLLDTWNAS